ncbi:MAG: hypothetical protein K6G28_04095 [Acholeplasmatales bacterium]|nr:hypothetical protein [Acholeplasmatales bacterium]
MKRYLKKILVALLVVFTFGLTSCAMSRANVYTYWKSSTVEYLGKDHIVEKINLSKISKKVNKQNEEDTLYVFFGSHDSSSSQAAIRVYNEQAIQYGIEKIYWVDSSSVSEKDQKKYQEKLGISDLSISPALYVFKNKTIEFDSSRSYYSGANSGKYSPIKLAQIAFKGLYDQNGEYKDK